MCRLVKSTLIVTNTTVKTYPTISTAMLCHACNDLVNGKSARWKGSYKATFDSDDGGGQLTSTDSTTWNPETAWGLDSEFDISKPGGFVHHLSGRAFLAAAQQGCQMCLRLYCQLLPKERLAIAEEPDDIDTSSADYDCIVGYGVSNFYQEQGRLFYCWHYSPRTLDDIFENRRLGWKLEFYASKGVFSQSS